MDQYWVVTDELKQECDYLFKFYDSDQKGYVTGDDIKEHFTATGLSLSTLAHIWDLCDYSKRGQLSHEEFALAMWLIRRKANEGVNPPKELEPAMVPPSRRGGEHKNSEFGEEINDEADEQDNFEDACDDDSAFLKELVDTYEEYKNVPQDTSSHKDAMRRAKGDLNDKSSVDKVLGEWEMEQVEASTSAQTDSCYHTPIESTGRNSEIEEGECTSSERSDGTDYYSNQSDSKAEGLEQKFGNLNIKGSQAKAGHSNSEVKSGEVSLNKEKELAQLQQLDSFKQLKEEAMRDLKNLEDQISEIQNQREEQERVLDQMEEDIKAKLALLSSLKQTAEQITLNNITKQKELIKNLENAQNVTANYLYKANLVLDQVKKVRAEIHRSITQGIEILQPNSNPNANNN